MITMQPSSSPPGPAHASPPVSPTITHLSTRGPTPSPPDNVPFSSSPMRRASSLSSTGSRSPSRRLQDTDRTSAEPERSPSPQSSYRASTSAGAGSKLPQLPLLQDLSQYLTPNLKEAASDSASTTLEELAHLVRLSTYQERKRSQSRIRLQRSLVATAISARLSRCGELAHRTLVDNFRADEKKNFAILYNAVHDVRNSCDATRRYALLEPDLDIGGVKLAKQDAPSSFSTFMHEIPAQSRETLLSFLSQIRNNSDFLATRLTSLTPAELSALTIFHQGLEPIDSVLPFHTRSRGHASSIHRTSAHLPSAVERLLSFQRHDPLSALIHTCFANSAGPDSAEDIRRTDVWATACARLITESKSGTDAFICSVLNIWAAMRDWSGRSNMEWYLMKILEDGAFLLEKAEDQAGTRIHVEPRNAKDSIAADEFYDAAVRGLFEVVDDPESGGIPEGLLELGNAILRKLNPKRHGPARNFLVSKWLFSVFLLNAIIHPESFGMLSEYHITEYGRQKILKEVAMRSQKLVVDLTWKQATPPPEIRSHIENIMSKFRTARSSRPHAKLLPARSITSLRETAEVHPYLVISPSDILTMVNALFPERRPASGSLEKDLHTSGFRSGTSSVSGVSGISSSLTASSLPRNAFDNASVVSTSGSSVISDITTSQEPLLNDASNSRYSSTSLSSFAQSQRTGSYGDEVSSLRSALQEMTSTLGSEAMAGSCHPCAERWAVLFISSDGKSLSTHMLHDLDDDHEEDDTTSSDDEIDDVRTKSDLDKDYHQLRDSTLKLVQEYEIPQALDTKSVSKTFSNRTTLDSARKKNRVKSSVTSPVFEPRSRNPYRVRDPSSPPVKPHKSASTERRSSRQRDDKDPNIEADAPEEPRPMLVMMLEAAQKQCRVQSDFVNAHLYFKTLQQLRQITSPSLRQDGFAELLNIFSRGPRDLIRHSASAIEEYDAWLVWLKQSQERHDQSIESMTKRLKALRDKMWYVTDVKNSAAYEGARNIAIALKTMASPKHSKQLGYTPSRPRNMSRSSVNNFLLRTEAQVIDMVTAPDDYGGPNKLSDDQSEKTLRWLSQYGIENFCKGEERIHRFCLEIDHCINKLVGDNLMDGPVLWSSELYYRDKKILDSGRQKGDLFFSGLGSLSVSDDGNDQDPGSRGLRNLDFAPTARPSHRDLRSMSARNSSQQSFDSNKWGMSRGSTTSDLMDSQDYFGMSSPVLTIDSALTFWSPFQTWSHSPSTSVSSQRPATASSTNDTIMLKSGESASMAKQRFLVDLKQTLTSLLISDLGNLVFARGSETDSWFSGDLGQECIERKERHERRIRKKKKRIIEKKKSFRDLCSAHKPDSADQADTQGDNNEKTIPTSHKKSPDTLAPEAQPAADTSSASDAITVSSRRTITKESDPPEFPYRSAFRRLLRMFSVHPNPYAKLNALYELEQLIIASITSTPQRRHRRDHLSISSDTQITGNVADYTRSAMLTAAPQAQTLEEAIDNCRERRSHAINPAAPSSPHHGSQKSFDNRREGGVSSATTDMIVDALQDLFRSASMRPKTLFRDLQFIASFVPAAILDKTERGKAFWDAGLAALGLKQDVCRTLVEIADEIVVHYTQTRQTSSAFTSASQHHSSTDDTSNPASHAGNQTSAATGNEEKRPPVMKYSMQDAAQMWTITAKEGDPVAERELAIFYLTHPELVARTTLPLTKPKDVFKTANAAGAGRESREGDKERNDPATMCVAYHWMEASARGGDELAKKYLRQREEMNAIG